MAETVVATLPDVVAMRLDLAVIALAETLLTTTEDLVAE